MAGKVPLVSLPDKLQGQGMDFYVTAHQSLINDFKRALFALNHEQSVALLAVFSLASTRLLRKENKRITRKLTRRISLPATPICPNDPKGLEEWLRVREKEMQEEFRTLESLHRLICQVMHLIILLCKSIATNSRKKLRLQNRYKKVVILILWRCGDIEQNPGPTISDISRDFCKKMISLLVIKYWVRKKGQELCQADYKKKPANWPENVWFGDPSTCKNETRNVMLKCLIEICLSEQIEVPIEWLNLIEKYEQLLSKGCQKLQRNQYADDLNSWLCQLRSLETVDQLFDKLADITDQGRNCVIERVFEKLKEYVPDLTSKSIQSRRIENEFTTMQKREAIDTATDSDIVFSNKPDAQGYKSIANETYACNIHQPDFSYEGLAVLGCPQNPYVDLSNCLTSPYEDNSTVALNIDVIDYNKGPKRSLDLCVGLNEDLVQFSPSKKRNTSLGFNTLQVNNNQDADMELTTLADLMKIVEPEMQTNADEAIMSASNDPKGDEPSGLMDELDRYLSDEFIYELSKQDNTLPRIATTF